MLKTALTDDTGVMSGTRTDGNTEASTAPIATDGGSEHTIVDSIRFGVLTYVLLGLGTFITFVLISLIGDEDASMPFTFFEDEALYAAASGSYMTVLGLVAIIAFAIGYIYHSSDAVGENGFKFGAAAASVGSAVILLVLLLLAMIFEPDFVDVDLGDELPVLIATVLGSAITAAATTFVLDNYRD